MTTSAPTVPAADLLPGQVVIRDLHRPMELTVVSVEPTGSVVFNEGSTVPLVRVTFAPVPKPFTGHTDVMVVAGDQMQTLR